MLKVPCEFSLTQLIFLVCNHIINLSIIRLDNAFYFNVSLFYKTTPYMSWFMTNIEFLIRTLIVSYASPEQLVFFLSKTWKHYQNAKTNLRNGLYIIVFFLQLNIIRMYRQLEYFQEYQQRVSNLIGSDQAKRLVKEALVLITVGGNDFVNNYYLVPFSARSRQYRLPDYVKYLISEYKKLLQVIYH